MTVCSCVDSGDQDFELNDEDESIVDEEDTISDEESKIPALDQQQNDEDLLKEADAPLEDLLPPEYLEYLRSQEPSGPDEPPTKRRRTSLRHLSAEPGPPVKEEPQEDDCNFDFGDMVAWETTSFFLLQ